MQNQRIVILKDKCINCGDCLRACEHQGLQAKGSTLDDISQYEKTIALISPAVFGECEDDQEIESLLTTIKNCGFDEIIELSQYEGLLYNYVKDNYVNQGQGTVISSFCPVINRLIERQYPMLLANLVPIETAVELAAKHLKSLHKQQHLGIFYLSECVAKLALGKYPYGNKQSSIDHCVSLVDLFPRIVKNKVKGNHPVDCCKDGLNNVLYDIDNQPGYQEHTLVADGLKRAQLALDLAEFNQLKKEPFLWLSNCLHGCVGGNLLWGNPFEATVAFRKHIANANAEPIDLDINDWINPTMTVDRKTVKTLKQRLSDFNKLQSILQQLPGYDCSACGYPSCRVMAEEILANHAQVSDCVILIKEES